MVYIEDRIFTAVIYRIHTLPFRLDLNYLSIEYSMDSNESDCINNINTYIYKSMYKITTIISTKLNAFNIRMNRYIDYESYHEFIYIHTYLYVHNFIYIDTLYRIYGITTNIYNTCERSCFNSLEHL